jgi:Tfp pilus assembly protein PilZ
MRLNNKIIENPGGAFMGRKMGYIYPVIVMCFLLVSVIPTVSADEDSIAVFLFIEDKENYALGDTVTITVHIFDKGDYLTTPDTVTVTVNATKNIPMSQKSDGIYEGTYKLNQSDAIFTFGDWHLYFNANASKNLNWDTARESLIVPGQDPDTPELSVWIEVDDPKDRTPRPGDDVELTITVKEDGTKVDAQGLNISTPGGITEATRTGTGVYTFTYKVPSNKVRNEIISIGAEVNYNGQVAFDYISLPLDFLNVWMHNSNFGKTHADFEIWVADLDGRAVVGAVVFLSAPKSGSSATTNKEGKAVFSLDYLEPTTGIVELVGEVSAPSEDTQTFSYSFIVGDIENGFITTPGEFEVFPASGDRRGEPGDQFTVEYEAYNDTKLWTNKSVHYYTVFRESYYSSEGLIIDYGTKTTNANGRFEITFTAPNQEGFILVYFKSAVEPSTKPSNDNYRYKETTDTAYIMVEEEITGTGVTDELNVNIGELILGGEIDVTATMAGSSGLRAKVFWELSDDNWTWLSGQDYSYLTESDNKFTGSVYIPEFLPQDQNYIIGVRLIDTETGTSYDNGVQEKPVGVAPGKETEEEGLDFLTIALIIIVIVVVIVLLIAASRGGKGEGTEKESPEEEEGKESGEEKGEETTEESEESKEDSE